VLVQAVTIAIYNNSGIVGLRRADPGLLQRDPRLSVESVKGLQGGAQSAVLLKCERPKIAPDFEDAPSSVSG